MQSNGPKMNGAARQKMLQHEWLEGSKLVSEIQEKKDKRCCKTNRMHDMKRDARN